VAAGSGTGCCGPGCRGISLCRLADSGRAVARRSRLPVEQRPYRPHLTLAWSDGVANLRPLVERLAPWEGLPWVATRLYLIRQPARRRTNQQMSSQPHY
jgi:2'-5' RNA ligase